MIINQLHDYITSTTEFRRCKLCQRGQQGNSNVLYIKLLITMSMRIAE